MVNAVEWKGSHLQLLDQRRLPTEETYLELTNIEQAHDAIQQLVVRGAPAIGITAAYGLYLGMLNSNATSRDDFFAELDDKIAYLSAARPTAVNLFWALAELKRQTAQLDTGDINVLTEQLLTSAKEIHEDDRLRCDAIGDHGVSIIPDKARVMTHCNAGSLATGGIGTALGVIYRAHEHGKDVEVFANETRPILQGARLTVWELQKAGVPANLICDNMAAAMMQPKILQSFSGLT